MSGKNWSWHRVGVGVAGISFMILGVLLIIPLPLDGDWYWDPSWLDFLFGILAFAVGLWTLVDGLRSPSPPPPPSHD